MILLYLLFVIIVGVICWKIIYEALFKDDSDEIDWDEEAQKLLDLVEIERSKLSGVKPWADKLDEQFKQWEEQQK